MVPLDLTHEEMQQILLAGRRYLINEGTHPDDLKAALLASLRERKPGLAGKIEQLGRAQMMSLCQTILAQQGLHA